MRYERSFQIGEREMVRFHFRQSLREKVWGMLGLSLAGMLVIYLYLSRMVLDVTLSQMGIGMVCGFLGMFAALCAAFYVPVLRHVRQGLKKLRTDHYAQSVVIDGFGVRVTANGREAKLPFDKIHLVQETRRDFYLYVTDTQAWLLPKEQMEDPAAESETLRTIFSAVLERRRLRLLRSGQ